ncbi:MAG: hypothetical protein IJE73_03895 [Muribaculaceae bacterium]|nr:hypothetical protein [Muribaculaceae bacterium]
MKLQYKLGIMALGLFAFTSCEKNDPFADPLEIGPRVPTCYWEVGSTTCKAGGYFSFKGQYYTEDGHTPSHSEVWYNVTRTDEGEATAKLAGSSFAYKKSYSFTDTVRMNQSIYKFEHSLAVWDGYEFVLTDSVPVSETLTPVNWNNPKEWEDGEVKKFNLYFPTGYAEEFEKTVDSLIVTNANYNALRYLYINYAFTNERFGEINTQFGTDFPTDIKYSETDAQEGATDKSTRWIDYNNPKVSGKAAPIVGYYYQTIDEAGNPVYSEVATEDVYADESGNMILASDSTTRTYAVYESAPWVFSRYDDDLGSVVSTVRPEYIEAFKALVEPITFKEWIGSNDGYAISFKRKYFLDANFRVYDTEGNCGKAHTNYSIEIN